MLIVMRALGLAFLGAIIFMSNTAKSYGLDCPNKGLDAVPENIPRDTVKLDLSYNEITVVPANSLSSLPYLRILQLDNNKIQCIDKEAFSGMPQLVSLTLH